MENNNFISFEQVNLENGFWKDRYELNKNVSVDNVRKRFENSGRFDAMRFNFLKNGYKPHIFFDSDVAKWMEAVAYLIEKDPDAMKENEKLCEELIDCMEKAQRDDGYLNSFHQQIAPEEIFQNRDHHELYCAGHLIEAAIAYSKATGRDKFLHITERYCDCIYKAFISKKTAAFTTPGHEEIELALIKLYRYTNNEKYLEMAKFFLTNRGKADEPYLFENSRCAQDDTDIYNLHEANGHCVRALYLYSGIADLARETNSEALLANLKDVFHDIIYKKMYITGGVGSTYRTESFTVPYDLPNINAYSESCCAIAMIMFALRMREIDCCAEYGHIIERVLYNSLLSSTSTDGKSFFYVNPLELALEEYGRETAVPKSMREHLPITQRLEVFDCSCCPPNINRFFAGLGNIICLEEKTGVAVEQYINAEINSHFGKIKINGDYFLNGKIEISSNDYTSEVLAVRIPEWCTEFSAKTSGACTDFVKKNGYAYFTVKNEFCIMLDFHIKPQFISANPNVRADAGRVALTYGPIVYCLEGADNGDRLNRIEVDISNLKDAKFEKEFHNMYSISMPAYRLSDDTRLYYSAEEVKYIPVTAKFVPYYSFANRGESDMLVWVRKH